MANISSSWILFDEKNVERLRERCLELIHRRGTTQKELAYEADRWGEAEMSKWLHKNSVTLEEKRYHPLLAFVAASNVIAAEDIDEIFAGIADFLGYGTDGAERQLASFVGHYVTYRYSYLAPGRILQGSLEIWHDEKLRALRTKEDYHIQAEIFTQVNNESENLSPGLPMNFARNGYFFPRGPDSYVMISRKSNRGAHDPTELQTVYFENVHESAGAPALLQGFLTDWHKKKFYSTRVVARKVAKPIGQEQILTFNPCDVNDVINSYLTPMPSAHKYIISY